MTVNASMDSADCTSPVCELVVQLSSYAALRDVQVCVHVSKPLLANVDFYTVANLCERISLSNSAWLVSTPRRIFISIFRREPLEEDGGERGRGLAVVHDGRDRGGHV